MEEGKFFAFGPTHLNTTLEMERVINEIESLNSIKSNKDMFADVKIKELLWMQMDNHMKVKLRYNPTLEKYREQMMQAVQFIESNISKDFKLTDVSRHVGVCETILKIAFKYFYGKTVFTYLNEYRMQNACDLLRDSKLSISEVALMSGFEHSSYFSTVFKQKHGITPLEYRKMSG